MPDFEIENDRHVPFRIVDDAVDFEFSRIVVDGGIFFQVTLGLLVLAVCTAPLSEIFEGIYAAIQSILAIIQGPTLGLLLPGMFSSRITGRGGLWAMLVGLTTSIGFTVQHKLAEEYGWPFLFNADEPFFAIATISFVVTVVVNYVVSYLSPPHTREELRGLVFRWADDDDEAQDALKQRG